MYYKCGCFYLLWEVKGFSGNRYATFFFDRTESLDYGLNIQVSGGETLHPKLPNFVLAFQPSDLSSPSWIKRVTERRTGRVRPQVLGPGEGTFIE